MSNGPETDWSSEATINASLSHLEDLHYQIQTLRTLVPTRLLAPLRGVTSPNPSSSDSLTSPESLYEAINSSITAGQNEILSFRTAWKDETTTQIRQQAHKRRRLDPKGWIASVPESMGLRGGFEGDGESTDLNLENGDAERESDGLDELGGYEEGMDFQKTVEAFQKDNPKVTVHSAGEVAIVVICGAHLRVEKRTKGDEAGHWRVTRKEQDNKTPLMRAMMQCVERRGRKGDLRFLLVCIFSFLCFLWGGVRSEG
jgi:hypothetical protein